MKTLFFSSVILLGTLLLLAVATPNAGAAERRYRLTVQFTEPNCKMSWTLHYREDFRLSLDDCPITKNSPFPAAPFVAGSLYPKNGATYFSIEISSIALDKPNPGEDKADRGESFSQVKHIKLPDNHVVELPPVPGVYKSCKATITFLP